MVHLFIVSIWSCVVKKILVVAIASCLPSIASAQALQWAANQRNSTNTAYVFKPCGTSPSNDAFFYRDNATDTCKWVTVGSGLSFSSGTLSASVTTGPTGATGATGATGPQGPQGIQGAPGNGGAQGEVGETGPQGATGPQGDVGPTGATGPQGAKGDTGDVGATGATGPAGATGATGIQGPTGATGIQGPKGDTGDTGPAGPTAFTYPTAISVSLGTAYRCLEVTKPCVVTVNLTSTASLSLTAGTTNTADIVLGSTSAVASGTGAIVGRYSNVLTGTLIVGLGINSAVSSGYTIMVPAGGYFAVRQTSGTVSVVNAFDQAAGYP